MNCSDTMLSVIHPHVGELLNDLLQIGQDSGCGQPTAGQRLRAGAGAAPASSACRRAMMEKSTTLSVHVGETLKNAPCLNRTR